MPWIDEQFLKSCPRDKFKEIPFRGESAWKTKNSTKCNFN
nr:MAG TPA: hypothetical protein [Caudoviricetes sp.]DAZ71655.1 MAG TPA: hypothetical protein [Caudoviricetes sp.]